MFLLISPHTAINKNNYFFPYLDLKFRVFTVNAYKVLVPMKICVKLYRYHSHYVFLQLPICKKKKNKSLEQNMYKE